MITSGCGDNRDRGGDGDGDGAEPERPVPPDRPDTARLRDRIANGDVDALGIAFDHYGVLVYELAERCCSHHRDHADNLTRATFLDLWTRPRQRPGWSLSATLMAGLIEQTAARRR